MSTKLKRKISSEPARDELRSAIASIALVRSSTGATIIASEHTGKRAPWLFDFRALMLQPKWLDRYAELFWEQYEGELPFQVGAMESAGIALVAAIVMKSVERGTPINGFFIRKSRKRQGLMNVVEGTLTNEKIILVDDLINSGQTIDKAADILFEHGKRVSDIFAILAFRGDSAYSFLEKKGVALSYLYTLEDFGLPLKPSSSPELPKDPFEVLWHYQAPEPSRHLVVQKSAPLFHEGRLYVGCDDGAMRCLDGANGDVVWEFKIGKHPNGKAILSSPALHGGILYFGAYDGTFYALDAATGQKRWTYTDADWIGSSPALAPELGLVFIGLEFGLFRKRGGVAALDMKTGALRWTGKHPEHTHASPLYIAEEHVVVIGSNDGGLYCYDAKSGVLRWRFQTRGDIKTRGVYNASHHAVVIGSQDGTLYLVSILDGTALDARTLGPLYSIPLIENGMVYVASLDKSLYAIDAATGKERWVYETTGRIFASPVIADGSLWIGSNDGKLYELDPKSGTLRNFFQATERIVNAIAFDEATKRLFVPTQANEIYCLKRK